MINGIQDLKIYSHAGSLILSLTARISLTRLSPYLICCSGITADGETEGLAHLSAEIEAAVSVMLKAGNGAECRATEWVLTLYPSRSLFVMLSPNICCLCLSRSALCLPHSASRLLSLPLAPSISGRTICDSALTLALCLPRGAARTLPLALWLNDPFQVLLWLKCISSVPGWHINKDLLSLTESLVELSLKNRLDSSIALFFIDHVAPLEPKQLEAAAAEATVRDEPEIDADHSWSGISLSGSGSLFLWLCPCASLCLWACHLV